MARHKMTEEEKMARRLSKDQAFDVVAKHLKHLSFAELEEVVALSLRYKKEKLGKEELRLIKEKEIIEQQLQKLKELDAK
jgi:aminoglycoside N3'-acetyltransferase